MNNLCRFCEEPLRHVFIDLGMSPPCQTHIEPHALNDSETFYPLCAYVCNQCFLVQLPEYISPEKIFTEYAYFSSYADTWLQHMKNYADTIVRRLQLDKSSRVVEIASNDGYLLQYFVQKGIPVLGIEPAGNVAQAALRNNIPTIVKFFGTQTAHELAAEKGQADLLIGNNVLAHVPALNDFVEGMKILLKPGGVITMEFPHLMRLMAENQFDTIYHEHFSYFSFTTAEKIFAAHGLILFDVEEIPTHGGSLRIYACHEGDTSKRVDSRAAALKRREESTGWARLETYFTFGEKVKRTKRKLLEFLIRAKGEGKSIAGYGAPGKGNTLLNYCGIRTDFVDYTVDRNPYKQGKFTPGTHIPIHHPDKIRRTQPDFVLILPWNLKDEIMEQMSYIRAWGGRFIVPIPEVEIY
jgi:SAM-dependent methyltransferase